MITIFNRKEVYIGQSIERYRKIRELLESHAIKYTYKVINRNNSQAMGAKRGYTGTFGEKSEYMYTYYIYVQKKDYEYTRHLIR